MSPTVRRQKLLEVLCQRRHDTYANLADDFHVSKMTIRRDVQALIELHYPLITVPGRYGGGVTIMEGYTVPHVAYTEEEIALLKKLQGQLQGKDLEIMNRIIFKTLS